MNALIVGAGGSGFLHALALRSAGVHIAAVYDPCEERAAWLAGLNASTVAASIEEAARSPAIDVVAICSPPAFHVAQAEAVAREGRLTFLEKPIACDAGGLARLEPLPGVVPILQWRAGRSAHRLRAAFASRTFGERPRITCDLRLWRDDEYWKTRDVKAWPCSAMLSIGIHAVDLILWCVGRPAKRTSFVDRRTRGELGLEFDDGTTAHVRIALDAPGQNDLRLRVLGDRASASLVATEEDPTASPLRWHGAEMLPVTKGATGSPLLVPYLHDAVAGEHPRVRDVIAAHTVLMGSDPLGAVDHGVKEDVAASF